MQHEMGRFCANLSGFLLKNAGFKLVHWLRRSTELHTTEDNAQETPQKCVFFKTYSMPYFCNVFFWFANQQ